MALSGTAAASGASCYSQEGCTENARSAEDFVASVGVNTHLGYSDTVYWQNWPMVRDRLLELGVSHIRDGTFPAHYSTGPTVAARYRETALGLNLLTGLEQAPSGPGGSGEGLDTRLNWIKSESLTSQVVGIEGSNESWNDATVIRNLQCDTYGRVKNDAVLASKPVIGPSAGPPFSQTEWYDRIGDLSACVDKGNLHSYPGADQPNLHQDRDLSVAMDWGRRTYGDKPYWATETGYWNTLADPNGVSEQAAAVYVPRATLEYFRRGIERTQLYELIDLNTSSDAVIDRYGLVRTDGTRKPAFTALANTMSIISDNEPASGELGFGIVCTSNCHSPIRHVLLKHSSGAYFLALWSESRVWDEGSKTDTPQAAQAIDLSLHQAPAKVEIFDPGTATSPQSTDTSGNKTVSTAARDTVRLIKITPAVAPGPSAAPAPTVRPTPALSATPLQSYGPAVDPVSGDDGKIAPSRPAPARKRCIRPKAVARITFSKARHANIRAHYLRAVRKGWPRILVLNRQGAKRRSDKLLKTVRSIEGRRPAAYPPALGRGRGERGLTRGSSPTGWRAYVAHVPSREKRSHEADMEAKLDRFCDGTRFRYIFK